MNLWTFFRFYFICFFNGLITYPIKIRLKRHQLFALFHCLYNVHSDSSMLKLFYFLSGRFQANPKDKCFPGMSLPAEQQNRVNQSRFPWWKFFSWWKIPRVKHFKIAFDWIWRDSLTFRYVINSDWFTYLNGKNIITKLTCAPPYHTIITLSIYFCQAKCFIILHIRLFPNYCFVVFCFNIQWNAWL